MKQIFLTSLVLLAFITVKAQPKSTNQKLDSLIELKKYYVQEIGLIDMKIQQLVQDVENSSYSRDSAITTGSKSVSEKSSQTYSSPAKTTTTASSKATPATTTTAQTVKPASATQRKYYTGSRGGCYYYSSSGKKVYVDRSYCN